MEGNRYPDSYKTSSKLSTAAEPTEESEAKSILFPYVARPVTEDMRQVCRQYSIKTSLRSASTPCRQLDWNHHRQVDWDKIKVLDKVVTNTTLLIKGAFHIASFEY